MELPSSITEQKNLNSNSEIANKYNEISLKTGNSADCIQDEDSQLNELSLTNEERPVSDPASEELDEKRITAILSRQVRRRKVTVHEAPEFTERLCSFTEVNTGETVTIVGRFRAWPLPTVTWYRDDHVIGPTVRQVTDTTNEGAEGVTKLIVKDVDKMDEGAYKCKVENDEGSATTTGYLSVSDKSAKSSSNRSRSRSPRLNASPSRRSDRSCTPSGLRPIVEQKSMEEHEEEECLRLGPSPIQDFIDDVTQKRSGLTKQARPLVFCPAEIYNTEDSYNFESCSGENDQISSSDEDKASTFTSTDHPSSIPLIKLDSPIPPPPPYMGRSHRCVRNQRTGNTNSTTSGHPSSDNNKLDSSIYDNDDCLQFCASRYSSLLFETKETDNSLYFQLPGECSSPAMLSDIAECDIRRLNSGDSDYDSGDSPGLEPVCGSAEVGKCDFVCFSNNVKSGGKSECGTRKSVFINISSTGSITLPEEESQLKSVESASNVHNIVTGVLKQSGVSLQERRLRMFSDSIHRSSSKLTDDNVPKIETSERTVSSARPLTVTISTTARRQESHDSGHSSGNVLLLSENPSFNQSAPFQNNDAVVASPSCEQYQICQQNGINHIYDSASSAKSQMTDDHCEIEFESSSKQTESDSKQWHGTIRFSSRAVIPNTCCNRGSKSIDIRIHTGLIKHPSNTDHSQIASNSECKSAYNENQDICNSTESSYQATEENVLQILQSDQQTDNFEIRPVMGKATLFCQPMDATNKNYNTRTCEIGQTFDKLTNITSDYNFSRPQEKIEAQQNTTNTSTALQKQTIELSYLDWTCKETQSFDPITDVKCESGHVKSLDSVTDESKVINASTDSLRENASISLKKKRISFFVEDVSLKHSTVCTKISPSEELNSSMLAPGESSRESGFLEAVCNATELVKLQRSPVNNSNHDVTNQENSGEINNSTSTSPREIVDKVFESLSQVRIQFYVLFVSLAAALAAAVAASGASTLLIICCPVLIVVGGVKAVLITEAFRYISSLLPLNRLQTLMRSTPSKLE